MSKNNEYGLKKSRDEKIKSLGFLCYNLYIDKVINFPEMRQSVAEISDTLTKLRFLRQKNESANVIRAKEAYLDKKVMEMGLICYNLFIDNKLLNNNIVSICNAISEMNIEIAVGDRGNVKTPVSAKNNQAKSGRAEKRLEVDRPYGMEPIPIGYKKCRCGYRNRHEAVFCAKCGAKI